MFPVGVESLAVKFEHTFKTKQTFSDVWAGTGTIGKGKTLRGSSSMKPCSDSLATARLRLRLSPTNAPPPRTPPRTPPLRLHYASAAVRRPTRT